MNRIDRLVAILTTLQSKKCATAEFIADKYRMDNDSKESQREIEPIGLTFYSNQWHLIAWCWKRKDYRDFKVNQITRLNSTEEKFRKTTHLDINGYINSIT